MNWVSAIIEWLGTLNPLFRVSVWEGGIRETYWPKDVIIWQHGRPCWIPRDAEVRVTDLGPGLHRRIPFFEAVHSGSVVMQVLELRAQHVTSRDGKAVSFSGNAAYRIKNYRRYMTKIHDFDHSIKGLAEIYLSTFIREHDWSYLSDPSHMVEIEKNLKKRLNKAGVHWGVRIMMVGLITLVQSKQYHLFQTQTMGPVE